MAMALSIKSSGYIKARYPTLDLCVHMKFSIIDITIPVSMDISLFSIVISLGHVTEDVSVRSDG